MTDERYDVIIIGGGPGGLSCGAMLAHRGARVLLLERNDRTGGKAVTAERDGFRYELGPKLQVPMQNPGFKQLFAALGMSDKLGQILLDRASVSHKQPDGSYRTVITPQTSGMDPTPFFDLWGLDDTDREKALAVLTEMVSLTPEQLDELDDTSMHDYLATRDVPWGLYSYLAMHANASLAEPIDLVAASEQIKIMQEIAVQGGGGYYYGGFGRVLDDIADAIRERGGTILTGTEVQRIDVDGGRVTGVTTSAGSFEAPIVVSDAGIQPTILKLAGRDHFDDDYVKWVENLVPGWGWATIRYQLDAPVLTEGCYIVYGDDTWWNLERYEAFLQGEIPDDVVVFISVPSFFDPSMAPEGKQVIITGSPAPADPTEPHIDALYERVESTLRKVFPDIFEHIERRSHDGPGDVAAHSRDSVLPGQGGECVGVGQIVGQCGTRKPKPATPLPGLFLTGCDAGAPGMGTHQATMSGMTVAGLVLDELEGAGLATGPGR
ncbi:MAG: NAD(P)/FAD-dependent oxidoreductase [Acidimicrobiia bacterium]|nr:NAD(P)/FAD-dependent oxidoreductase [Acidimicrobiia bacterium]